MFSKNKTGGIRILLKTDHQQIFNMFYGASVGQAQQKLNIPIDLHNTKTVVYSRREFDQWNL